MDDKKYLNITAEELDQRLNLVPDMNSQIASLTNLQQAWTPKNYIKKLGVCIEDTSKASDWVIPIAERIPLCERVTTEKLYETGTIMFTATPVGWKGVTKAINYDFTNVATMAIAFYIEDQYSFNTLTMLLASSDGYADANNDWTKYFTISLSNTSAKLHRGWNYIKVHKDDFTNVGEETWGVFKAIRFLVTIPTNKFNYAFTANDGAVITTTKFGIGGIYLNPTYDTPKLMFNFDDSSKFWYQNGFPYMRQKGIKGTMFVCHDHVAENGGSAEFYMSEAEHDVIYAAGFDIGNHSKTHGDLYAMTEAEVRAEYGDTQAYLVSKGWATGGWLSAPPQGKNNYITNKVLYELGYKFVRGNKPQHLEVVNSDNIMQFHTREIKGTTLAATVTGWIDTMISRGMDLSLFTHHVVESNPDQYSVTIADFQTIVDYAVTKRDAGDIEIVTMSEFYNRLSDKSIAQRGL